MSFSLLFLTNMSLFAGSKSNQKEPCDKKNSLVPLFICLALSLLSRLFVFHMLFLFDDFYIMSPVSKMK